MRRAVSSMAGLALLGGLALPGLSVTRATAAPPADPQQVITVRVESATSTSGILEAWEKRGAEFVLVKGPIPVYVGQDGVGLASERRSRTPRGVFSLTEAFGLASNPGAALPYTRVGLSHWWVSDVKSRYYNQMRVCRPGASCGFRQSRSEQLGAIGLYEYAIVMDYNREPVVAGRGSAFFLHVSEGRPTQGCISMAERHMVWLLRWLNPAEDPVISVNIGNAAYGVMN
jgi:L,D-peptidoglycan transpeptidase YkuD (ErfK/YbiS/YcfS/YnhG family)